MVTRLLLFLITVSALGDSYYVDSSRTSNGDGTEANPWKLWSNIDWLTVSNSVLVGETTVYYSSRGSWTSSGNFISGISGIDGKRVKLIGDEKYNLTAAGDASWSNETTTNRALLNSSSGNGGQLVISNNFSWVTIKGFGLVRPTWDGISLGGSALPTTGMSNISIINCIIDSPANNHGIWFGYAEENCHSILIQSNTIINSPTEGIYMGHYSYLTDSITNVIVEHNTLIDCGQGAATAEGDIDIKPACYGAIVRYNINTNTDISVEGSNCGIAVAADNCQVYGNLIGLSRKKPDNTWGVGIYCNSEGASTGKAVTSLLVYNNIIYSSEKSGIKMNATTSTVGADMSGVKILNNTIYGNGNIGIELSAFNGRTVTIEELKNNIIASNAVCEISINSAVTLSDVDNNLYYRGSGSSWSVNGSSKSWEEWKALGYDANGINADPALNTDYSLTKSSDAVDAGENLSAIFTVDFTGNTRSGTWDIGAYEYQSTVHNQIGTLQFGPQQGHQIGTLW